MLGQNILHEIKEGIVAVQKTINKASELEHIASKLKGFKQIYTIGCGSSYWAALILAELLRPGKLDVQTVVSSELLFYDYPEDEKTLMIAFSQSGETTETLKALEQAEKHGAKSLAIINQENSQIETLADFIFITPAGREAMVATKSFDTALAAAYILAKSILGEDYNKIKDIPGYYEEVLEVDIGSVIEILKKHERVYTIGTGLDYAVAGEAALKLEESALIQTNTLPILEISHGPKITTLKTPVILIGMQTRFQVLYKNILAELNAVGAKPIVYTTESIQYKNALNLKLPLADSLSIFLSIKLSQRLAIETALAKGLDPDNPPELKKFVTRDDLNIF